jgi:hypothetical protein
MEGFLMNRKSSNRRDKSRGAEGRRGSSGSTGRAHTLERESNFGIADDGLVNAGGLSARQRIEEYEARRRLWARVHWLDAFKVAPRG